MVRMIVFTVGGVGYPIIEYLWRGYSHWTMELVGGICFLAIFETEKRLKNSPLLLKCLLSASIITTVELISGILFNVIMNMDIWNYSDMPCNFIGQICLPYTFLWFLLSFPLLYLCRFIQFIREYQKN